MNVAPELNVTPEEALYHAGQMGFDSAKVADIAKVMGLDAAAVVLNFARDFLAFKLRRHLKPRM